MGIIVPERGPQGPEGPQGPVGPPGATSGDRSYEHNQLVPASTWSVTHNLGKYPSVTVIDSAGTEVEGDVNFVDTNSLTITFSSAFGGRASLN